MSEPTPLDIGRIVEALDRHGVEYLLVGGVAAAAHGAARLTADADTVVRRTAANLEATAAVLREINAYLLVEGLSDEEARALPVQIDALTLTRMEISTWQTDADDLDILVELPARDGHRLSYEDLLPRAVEAHYGADRIVVRIAALDDIIASKQWADRPKDRDALPELLAMRNETQDKNSPRDKPPWVGRRDRYAAPATLVLLEAERPQPLSPCLSRPLKIVVWTDR